MINLFDFVEECKAQGMSANEAYSEFCKAVSEEAQEVVSEYENSPETHYGWAQQDTIDMYRRER